MFQCRRPLLLPSRSATDSLTCRSPAIAGPSGRCSCPQFAVEARDNNRRQIHRRSVELQLGIGFLTVTIGHRDVFGILTTCQLVTTSEESIKKPVANICVPSFLSTLIVTVILAAKCRYILSSNSSQLKPCTIGLLSSCVRLNVRSGFFHR
jgi:hypothetical protein